MRATDEEDAATKVQAEFDRPYGYFGNWTTTTSEVEVVEVEQTTIISPNPISKEGPLLLGLKDAARALGISYAMLYELTSKGEIEWARVGTRKYVSRESLLAFITANTHRDTTPATDRAATRPCLAASRYPHRRRRTGLDRMVR